MKNRKILIMTFVGFGLALLIGIALIILRVQPSCWTNGAKPLLYSVQMNESNANAASQLKGMLQFKLKEAPSVFSLKKPLIIEGQFKPLEFASNGQLYTQFRDFTYAFRLEVDSKCHVQKLSFDGRETFSARRTLQRLVRILALGREGLYSDFLGESEMKMIEDQTDLKSFTRVGIRKSVQATHLEEFIELESVKASVFRFEGVIQSLWHPKVSVEEQLVVYAGSKHEARAINYKVTMEQVTTGELLPAQDISKAFRVNKKLAEDLKGKDRPSIYDNVTKAPIAVDLKSALDTFRSQLAGQGVEAKSQLIEFLKAHPQAIKDLQKLIETNSFTDQELIHILFVLAKVGSEEAQEAIASLIGNESIEKGTRIRTIFAVGEIRVPNEAVVAAVRNVYQGLTTGQGLDELSSTALLNGGLLANNLREIKPGEEEALISDIEAVYKASEKSPELRANAIDAMGNSSSDAFADEVESSARSASDLERKAAYEALSRIPTQGREDILVQALGTDTIAPARLAALQTLKTVGLRQEASVEAMKATIQREPDAINRATAMQVLGQAIPFQAKAKDVLLEQVARESDPGVLQAAGRFVSAYDILNAKKKP